MLSAYCDYRHVIRQLEHMPIVAAVQCFAQGFDRSALDPIRDALSASVSQVERIQAEELFCCFHRTS
eukprot:SAG31_NODE_1020_length_10349_cov_5.621561_7_plen_67_part_00